MKVSIKPPSTHTSNDANIATVINNATLSQSGQQSNQPQLYSNQQTVYESTPQKNGLTTNVQLKNLNYSNNGQLSCAESDSKKYRRISDKSQDHQRFFKNLVELPTNQMPSHQLANAQLSQKSSQNGVNICNGQGNFTGQNVNGTGRFSQNSENQRSSAPASNDGYKINLDAQLIT